MQKNLSSAVDFGGKKGLQRIKNIESLFHGRKLRNLPTHKGADALFRAIFLRNQTNPLFLIEKTRKILNAFLKTYIRRAKHKIYYYVQAYCGNSRLRGVRRFILPQSRENIQNVSAGVLIWATSVLPALFPFFFLSKLLIELDAFGGLSTLLSKPTQKYSARRPRQAISFC